MRTVTSISTSHRDQFLDARLDVNTVAGSIRLTGAHLSDARDMGIFSEAEPRASIGRCQIDLQAARSWARVAVGVPRVILRKRTALIA